MGEGRKGTTASAHRKLHPGKQNQDFEPEWAKQTKQWNKNNEQKELETRLEQRKTAPKQVTKLDDKTEKHTNN